METINLQPQTLISLTALIKDWNQDPLAFNNSLLITRNQVLVTDGNTILLSLQFPIEDTDLLQDDSSNDHVKTNTGILLNEELNLPLQVNEPENIEELEFEDSESPTSKTKAKLAKIINDLTEEKHNTPLRTDPLLTYT